MSLRYKLYPARVGVLWGCIIITVRTRGIFKGGGKLFHPSPMSNSSQFPLFSGSKMTTAQVGIIDRLFPEKCGCSASNWLKSLKCQPTKQISNIPFLFVLCLPWAVEGSPYNEEKPTNEHHHSCLKLLYWNALWSAVKSPSISQPILHGFSMFSLLWLASGSGLLYFFWVFLFQISLWLQSVMLHMTWFCACHD